MTDDNTHSHPGGDGNDVLERELSAALATLADGVTPRNVSAADVLAEAADRPGADPFVRRRRATTASLAAAAVVLTVVGVVAINTDRSDQLEIGAVTGSNGPATSDEAQVTTSVVPWPMEVADETLQVTGTRIPSPDPDAQSPLEHFDVADAPSVPTIAGRAPDGSPLTVAPGAPRLIVVVAHWCPHCQAELPALRSMLTDGTIPGAVDFTVVSTAVDPVRGNYPPSSWIRAWLPDVQPLVDDRLMTAANALGVSSFPMFLAIDADGRLLARGQGQLDADQVRELVGDIVK